MLGWEIPKPKVCSWKKSSDHMEDFPAPHGSILKIPNVNVYPLVI